MTESVPVGGLFEAHLTVSDLSLRSIPFLKSIFLIRLLNVSDLGAETRNLFPKNF